MRRTTKKHNLSIFQTSTQLQAERSWSIVSILLKNYDTFAVTQSYHQIYLITSGICSSVQTCKSFPSIFVTIGCIIGSQNLTDLLTLEDPQKDPNWSNCTPYWFQLYPNIVGQCGRSPLLRSFRHQWSSLSFIPFGALPPFELYPLVFATFEPLAPQAENFLGFYSF